MIERVLAAIFLLALMPLLALIVLGYWLNGHGRVLFVQRRIGLNQEPFQLYKFKTLLKDNKGELQQREFFYGRLLRNSSLDELPQLVNIIKGEMSFIGPRPLPVEYLPYFSVEQKKRFLVKPGVTGLAQVSGRTSITWDEKLSFDIYYVERRNYQLKLKILIKTIAAVFNLANNSLYEQSFIDYVMKKKQRNTAT